MSNRVSNQQQSPASEIQDYLRGYGRHGGFSDVEHIDNASWQALATQAIAKRQQERATRLLELLSDQALAAVAKGQVEITDQIASVKYKASA